jgi:tetratricopeptide (TPR) repeat protein
MDNESKMDLGDLKTGGVQGNVDPGELFELGKQAQSEFDYPQAIDLFSEALFSDIQPRMAYEILDQRAECHDLMGQFKEELEDLDQMVSIAQELGDAHMQTDIVFRQLFTAARMGASGKIHQIAESTKKVGENSDEISISAAVSLAIGYNHWILEEKTEAQENFEQALLKYRAAGDRENEANTLAALGSVVLDAGNQELSGKYSRDALEIWRSLGNRKREASSINAWSLTTSDYAQKRDAGEEALEIFISIGDRCGQCQMYNNLS